MSDHKFKVGQSVNYLTGTYGREPRSDVFKIMQCLPAWVVTISGSLIPAGRLTPPGSGKKLYCNSKIYLSAHPNQGCGSINLSGQIPVLAQYDV